MRFVAPLLVFALAACSDYTDPGSGSKTLKVTASAIYDASLQSTYVTAAVTLNGSFAEGATVRVAEDESGRQYDLTVASDHYETRIDGPYRSKLELTIQRGDNDVHASLEGPGPHIISSPSDGDTVSTEANTVELKWTTSDGLKADIAAIDYVHQSDNSTRVDQEDKGHAKLPYALQEGDVTLTVLRINQIALDGAIAGSTFAMGYVASRKVEAKD